MVILDLAQPCREKENIKTMKLSISSRLKIKLQTFKIWIIQMTIRLKFQMRTLKKSFRRITNKQIQIYH